MSRVNSWLMRAIADASNIRGGNNPPYSVTDFIAMFPQFGEKTDGTAWVVPKEVIQMWVDIARGSVYESRFHNMWKPATGFFIAHWLTLYLTTMADPDSPLSGIINAGMAKGMQSSKSAGSLSVSYDFSSFTDDFDGWGSYKQTTFGQQFITLAKMHTLGGMYVR